MVAFLYCMDLLAWVPVSGTQGIAIPGRHHGIITSMPSLAMTSVSTPSPQRLKRSEAVQRQPIHAVGEQWAAY